MSVLVNFAIFPTDKGTSISPYVARVERAIRALGFQSQLGPMSTVVETETMAEALRVLQASYDALAEDCTRVYCTATFDIKQSPMGRMQAKLDACRRAGGMGAMRRGVGALSTRMAAIVFAAGRGMQRGVSLFGMMFFFFYR